MGLVLDYQDGQTPLDEDEKEGLLIKTITTHTELNEHEQLNIEKAIEWTIHNHFDAERILSSNFIKTLHKKMFGEVWAWAGKFRKTEKNIGVAWSRIDAQLKYLLDDTLFWIEHETFPPDEIAIRFKHRLVNIHCFPNGNGRHSRIMADIIIESIFDRPVFSWANAEMIIGDATRKRYIAAIQEGDRGDIVPLLEFARSGRNS